MLNVDLTRAARSHTERVALITAIETAPASEPEADWVEWKSQLDLSGAEGAFKCASSLLGFGNRDPDYASRYAHGCAYFLVGVEPTNLTGTTVHDPADVEQWLAPYIAAGEPQWSVDYIDVQGKSVMLVTVEAPRFGDPIFTLRKGYDRTKAGAIFVRRGGKTDFASPADIARLAARSGARVSRVDLGVEWDAEPELRAITFSDDAMEQFAAEAKRLQRWEPPAGRMFTVGLPRDMRYPTDYDADVARYLENLPRIIQVHAAQLAVDRGLAELKLVIRNETDLNFARTQVTLRLPAGLGAFFDSDELHEVLDDWKPPREWGTESLLMPRLASPPVVFPRATDDRDVRRTDDALVVLQPSVDVRPRTAHPLKPVYLRIPASMTSELFEIGWRATSTSADGAAERRELGADLVYAEVIESPAVAGLELLV